MDDFCFFFKVEQTSLFEGLHPFFERMLSSSFEEVEGIAKISRKKRAPFTPQSARRDLFLSR